MPELIPTVSVPKTLQELDEAVKQFQASDFSGEELICRWQAIRDASLKEFVPELQGDPYGNYEADRVLGDQSY